MTNLAARAEIASTATPMVHSGGLTIPESDTTKQVYVRYQDNGSQFSFTEDDGYFTGGLKWSYDKNATNPPSLEITFVFVGDVEKLTDPSPTDRINLGTWQSGATQQTCTVAAAEGTNTFKVKTKNGKAHDPKIVVTPQ